MPPKIEFHVSKSLNAFCHFSILYSDLMPARLTNGILANPSYQEKYHSYRHDDIRLQLQRILPFKSATEWYEFAAGLTRRDGSGGFHSFSSHSRFADWFQDLSHRHAIGFEDIWREARPRLESYSIMFESQWHMISDDVLLGLRDLTRTHWQESKIHVYYINCLQKGFYWNDWVGINAHPDMDVQNKLLSHELSDLITTQPVIEKLLGKLGIDSGMVDTFVDMFAYFSLTDAYAKAGLSSRESKIPKPDSRQYPAADVLFPILEHYTETSSKYPDFESAMSDLIAEIYPPALRPASA